MHNNKKNVMDFSLRSDADIVITNTCSACVNEITQKGKVDDYDDVVEQLEKEAQEEGWRVVDGEALCPACVYDMVIKLFGSSFVENLRAQLEDSEFVERVCEEAKRVWEERVAGENVAIVERKINRLALVNVGELLVRALTRAVEES